jgi:hypothetical protein
VRVTLSGISSTLLTQNRIAAVDRCVLLALDLAALIDNQEEVFRARLGRFRQLALTGRWVYGEEMWKLLDPMGRKWRRAIYRPGMAELAFAQFRYWRGSLSEQHLIDAENLARTGRDRHVIRQLLGLRGQWQLDQFCWEPAAKSLNEAVQMARAVGTIDSSAEVQLALANFNLGRLTDPRYEAERLSRARNPAHGDLAALWLVSGNPEQAKKHALVAFKWAWADGEPFVRRHELNKARALLEQLGAEIPDVPPYDPVMDEKLPWEDEVASAIDRLRVNKSKKLPEADS